MLVKIISLHAVIFLYLLWEGKDYFLSWQTNKPLHRMQHVLQEGGI